MAFQSEGETDRTGLQVLVTQPGVINLARRTGDTLEYVSQRSINTVVVRIRLERDVTTGDLSMFFNDEQLGKAVPFTKPDAPITPVLFVHGGGVIVSVTDWTVTLH